MPGQYLGGYGAQSCIHSPIISHCIRWRYTIVISKRSTGELGFKSFHPGCAPAGIAVPREMLGSLWPRFRPSSFQSGSRWDGAAEQKDRKKEKSDNIPGALRVLPKPPLLFERLRWGRRGQQFGSCLRRHLEMPGDHPVLCWCSDRSRAGFHCVGIGCVASVPTCPETSASSFLQLITECGISLTPTGYSKKAMPAFPAGKQTLHNLLNHNHPVSKCSPQLRTPPPPEEPEKFLGKFVTVMDDATAHGTQDRWGCIERNKSVWMMRFCWGRRRLHDDLYICGSCPKSSAPAWVTGALCWIHLRSAGKGGRMMLWKGGCCEFNIWGGQLRSCN